ncbi:MAG: RDD family protein [Akkermansiaceae bacterium]|nr:RDD family protein [Akkermansiaceae bacterium]
MGQDIKAVIFSPVIVFLRYLPWFLIEPILLHYFGTTLGKWLMGLRVVNQDDSKLDLTAATKRSLRVMLTGVGFGWSLLAIFCQILSFFTARKLGNTFWDHVGQHKVTVAPLHPFRLIALVFIFAAALVIETIIIWPHIYEIHSKDPSFKEQLEKNPLWPLLKPSK